ncbi:2Fe-2S iron-sulfur cluster binding domain-containing protein [Pseudomonas sp. SWRI79]|uniref:2Fe-2S iron-sulfur cluster binding domain-containing protein n=1 Tax=Pseudomonas farris TaxID=2841207 RepID=A0ABS6Q008_9PSED|nr:2Fe-2S iron-sulfur cluster binding domain-containing protein [Pseudomonas farris]MBV4466062.1 2Fe-2S iron-sulfur cluster binding domain-containing protein [Pseudomonas farris]
MSKDNFTLTFSGSREPVTQSAYALVDACEKLGIIRTRCRQGKCGACQIRIISGDYEEIAPMLALTEKEIRNNAILPCVLVPLSDIEVEAWYK